MLHEFLATNHDELVKRCKEKAVKRVPGSAAELTKYGVSDLLGQLVDTLRADGIADEDGQVESVKVPADIGNTAALHGSELLRKGFSVEQVVHDYGDLCQAVTELAQETNAAITVDEFHTFNRCLDNAIADAVTEFGRQRDLDVSETEARSVNERLGFFAHELRNLLNTAMLAFQAVQGSNATVGGATGALLGRSLVGLRDLIDRSLADVRLTEGLEGRRESIVIADLVADLEISAAMEAKARELAFTIRPIEDGLAVDADRQMISAAITNLLQNAFKFTHSRGHVSLTAYAVAGRVRIDIEDECGGLPPGRSEELFQPFSQRSPDRSGLGLGLSISRRGVEASGGTLSVRNIEGKGCLFSIDLPRGRPMH